MMKECELCLLHWGAKNWIQNPGILKYHFGHLWSRSGVNRRTSAVSQWDNWRKISREMESVHIVWPRSKYFSLTLNIFHCLVQVIAESRQLGLIIDSNRFAAGLVAQQSWGGWFRNIGWKAVQVEYYLLMKHAWYDTS